MKLNDIIEEGKIDLKIDETLLDEESLKSVSLMQKWSTILNQEELLLLKHKQELAVETRFKIEYFRGKLGKTELKERGLSQFLDKLSNSDISRYLDSDEEIQKIKMKNDYQIKKIELIRNYMDAIRQRTWSIKNAIEYKKYISGA